MSIYKCRRFGNWSVLLFTCVLAGVSSLLLMMSN